MRDKVLKSVSNGFYKELEELRTQGLTEASFGFLENTVIGDYFNLYDFLHGHCDEFAAALSDYYGYPVEYILDTSHVLVHAYCTAEVAGVKAYIDARGITTDPVLFFDEFADFCTYEKDIGRFYDLKGECQLLRHKNTREMYNDENRNLNQDKDLVAFFKDNNSYYDVKLFEKEIAMNTLKKSNQERLSEIPTEILQKMSEEAFGAYYAEATKPCGSWSPDMKFPELEKATNRLNEINDELDRRLANNVSLADQIKMADVAKKNVFAKSAMKQIEKER